MADNAPPPIVRHQIWGQAPKAHLISAPQMSRMNMIHQATLKPVGGGGMGAFASGGSRRSLGGQGQEDAGGDPVVSGLGYDKNPIRGGILTQLLTGGGNLTEEGKAQQGLHQRFQQGMTLYNQLLEQGASQQQALTQVVRQDPSFLVDVMISHPKALKAFQSANDIHDFMSGKTAQPIFGNMTKEGQQPLIDPSTGQVVGMQDVPGFKGADKNTPIHTVTDKEGNIYNVGGTGGNITAQPVLGPNGPLQAPPKGKPGPQMVDGADNLGPQLPTTGVPTGSKSEDRLTMRQLPAIATAINLMEDIKQKAGTLGVIKGPLATFVGQYAGANPVAASIRADMDNLDSLASALQGSVYAGAIKSMKESYATSNDAPSFIRTQLEKTQDMLRAQGQAAADNVGDTRGVAVDRTLANQLMSAGIIPNGYQTPEVFQQLGPQVTGEWKLRTNNQDKITSNERKALLGNMLNGAYGPAPDPSTPPEQQALSPMAARVDGYIQQRQAQKQAAAQQQTATQNAAAANKNAQVRGTANAVEQEKAAAATPAAPGQQEQGGEGAGEQQDQDQQQQQQPAQPSQEKAQEAAAPSGATAAPSAVTPPQPSSAGVPAITPYKPPTGQE